MQTRRLILNYFLIICLCLLPSMQAASAKPVPEYELKATFIYHFAQLAEWPPNNHAENFKVCLYGKADNDAMVGALRGKTINNQPIDVVFLKREEDVNQCQLVFIGEPDSERYNKLLYLAQNQPVLTITDQVSVFDQGSIIYLLQEDGHLKFEINNKYAKRANLNLSSKLLRHARHIVE